MGLTVLDASVIIAVLDAEDPHHERAAAALRLRREAGDTLILPASAYAEVLVGPFRRDEAAAAAVDDFLAAIPAAIQPADRRIARAAARLRAEHGRRLRLPDALVVGSAMTLAADRVLTTDREWPGLPVNVEVV